MTSETKVATVIEVACLTEDRSAVEQRALLDTALDLDRSRGEIGVVTRMHPVRPYLVELVVSTYKPSAGREVGLTASQRRQYDALLAKWEQVA